MKKYAIFTAILLMVFGAVVIAGCDNVSWTVYTSIYIRMRTVKARGSRPWRRQTWLKRIRTESITAG